MTKLLDWLRSGGGKSRKTSSPPRRAVENISDLSGDALAAVAEYLPKTSRALLAVALTAPPSAWRERGWRGEPSDAGRAILAASASSGGPYETVLEMCKSELKGSERFKLNPDGLAREKKLQKSRLGEYYSSIRGWGVLDFLDLEADLAAKLTDDDVGAVLACIDAHRNLKKLYLTKCSGFVGDGLEPLRGSAALEQIDFDILPLIASYDKANTVGLSLEKAFSVMGSILTLRRMRVPRKWMVPDKTEKKLFAEFLSGHKHALNMSAGYCHFGFGESNDDFVSNKKVEPTETCRNCNQSFYTSCVDCNTILCADIDCRRDWDSAEVCSQCSKTSCRWCRSDGEASVKWCDSDVCDDYCDDCRYISCRGWGNDCMCCKGMVFDRLLQESTVQAAEMDRLRAENAQLRRGQQEG